jgi:hypothetical protein
MRIVADESAMICEFRAFNPTTGTEDLIDRYEIGDPVENDAFDDFSFFGESGLTVHLSTRTPNPEATPLDPSLKLFAGSQHELIADATGGDGDGRNVRLTHRLAASGKYRIRVCPEGAGGGEYVLEARFDHPAGEFAEWRASQFPANDPAGEALVDADEDGLVNFVEYALGQDPLAGFGGNGGSPAVPGIGWRLGYLELALDLPVPLPLDVSYQLEASADLGAERWTTIATKSTFRWWEGPAAATTVLTAPDRQRCILAVPLSSLGSRQFFRLRVVSLPVP